MVGFSNAGFGMGGMSINSFSLPLPMGNIQGAVARGAYPPSLEKFLPSHLPFQSPSQKPLQEEEAEEGNSSMMILAAVAIAAGYLWYKK